MSKEQIALYVVLAIIVIFNMRKLNRNLNSYKKNNPAPGTKNTDSDKK